MKRLLAVLCIAGVLLSACKSGGDSTTTEDTTASTAAASTAAGQGVTDSSIKIGVTYTDLSKIKDIVKIDHGDYLAAFQDLADDINADDGINGRKIELVDGPVDPVGTDSASAVCTKLTEDEKVFAVVGNVQADATPCFVTDHDTALVGGQQKADTLAAAKAPWFAYDAGQDFLAEQTIKGAGKEGTFKGKKVGIISLPVHATMIEKSVTPILDKSKVEVTSSAVLDVDPNDQAAARAAVQTYAQRFKADGVDVVIAIGDAFLPLVQGLENSDYRPTIVATDSNVVNTYLATAQDDAVLDGLVAGGPQDAKQGWSDPSMKECVAKIQKAEPGRNINDPSTASPDTPNTWVSVSVACQAMTLFEAIAKNAGKTLNNDTFRNAGNTLGEITIPGKGGPSNFSAKSPSGNPPVFIGTYDPATKSLKMGTTPVS